MSSDALGHKFFSIDELVDAIIVDSEGLIYGKVRDYYLEGGKLFLRAYIEVKAKEKVVHLDKIVSTLREKGINIPADAPLELIVARAREEGLDIPYRVAKKTYRLLKGIFPVDEILWIDSIVLEGKEGREEKITVVLLKTPREAMYRGLPEQRNVPLVGEDYFRDKLVLSLGGGILGYASELVIGSGEVGLRVYKRRGTRGYINWLGFITWLRRKKKTGIAEKLSEFIDPYRNSRLELSKLEEIKALLNKVGATRDILKEVEKYITYERGTAIYTDIPWRSILKLRDAVIIE